MSARDRKCEICGEVLPARWKYTVCQPCEQALQAVGTKASDWARALYRSYMHQVWERGPEHDRKPTRDFAQLAAKTALELGTEQVKQILASADLAREAQAQMAWLDLGEWCGLLVRREDVDAQVRRAFLTCRTQLYRLPGIVAAGAAERPASECEEVTRRAVDETLRQLEVETKKIGGRVPEEDEPEELEDAT